MALASDYFYHLIEYQVAVCKTCRLAIWPVYALSHLQGNKHHLQRRVAHLVQDDLATWDNLCQAPGDFTLPKYLEQPLKELPLFYDGLLCLLDPSKCTFIGRNLLSLDSHWHKVHHWSATGTRGGCSKTNARRAQEQRQHFYRRVLCQRLFRIGLHSSYIEVRELRDQESATTAIESSVAALVMSELEELESQQRVVAGVVIGTASAREVNPWLELTRWPIYLAGTTLSKVAQLVNLPDARHEPLLDAICTGLDRLVQAAYNSVCSDRINAFDQVRINSFMQRPRASDRPLLIKLQKPTYHRYKKVWKALLCFAYRTAQPGQPLLLQHQLNTRQVLCLDQLGLGAERVLHSGSGIQKQHLDYLDQQCLEFCISLLDHDLRGSLFESVVVGFLAVLGIDRNKDNFREAYSYGPTLSGFIKIGQMLVIQKAVEAAGNGDVDYPSDLLDEMRDRFMTHGTRSPFSWANRLRMYAKKVRDSTTSLGYIDWSNDGETVSYKDVVNLSVAAFKKFVADQVAQAQKLLEGLLLLHPSEQLHKLGVGIKMHQLVDNAVEGSRGYSFLQHPDNLKGALPDKRNWLLRRVLHNDWLQDEFIEEGRAPQVLWKTRRVEEYMQQVDAFLERLLLLVHLTSGQPARGTELLTLRYENTLHGHHRSVFIDNGMVSTVTSYHKGYSVTGSTSIIHRYLPTQVGELVVYYLWLILPFWQKLDLLALHRKEPPSPFLWPKGQGSWDSSRLSLILKKQFAAGLGQPMNIPIYRHLAIAISRKHLPTKGFKRDYGLEDTVLDKQSSHSTCTAGTIYARGLEEAAGQVTERRAAYRSISKEWHHFLGFAPASLPSLKRPLTDVTDTTPQAEKRGRWEF
jgi:hypothetical protein